MPFRLPAGRCNCLVLPIHFNVTVAAAESRRSSRVYTRGYITMRKVLRDRAVSVAAVKFD